MEEEEENGKEGVPQQGPQSPSSEDVVDRSAAPGRRSSSKTLLCHPPADSSSPTDSFASVKARNSRSSVRGPRLLVNRRSRSVKTKPRRARLSRTISIHESFATQRLSLHLEPTHWPLAPRIVSVSNTDSWESDTNHHLPGAANHFDRRKVSAPQRTPSRHGRARADKTSAVSRNSLVAGKAETHSRYERSVVEGVVAGEAAPEHPRLVRYIAQPAKLSPARNPSIRLDLLKDGHAEGIKSDAHGKGSPSMARRIRASLRWKKPRKGEETPGLRRGAVRRSTTTVTEHTRAKLLFVPRDDAGQVHVQPEAVRDVQGEEQLLHHDQDQHR
ncbi:hypothetical protein E2C01_090618 [Portunus trituberculatus]|uniref:Uncharacterized protein n=1 Tax=Portunus trituberculatus TaxID=210409 RepID=A0A5B7JQU8_PORTR|nr:hypothetical protein [Portunus trituberculatus]